MREKYHQVKLGPFTIRVVILFFHQTLQEKQKKLSFL